MVYSCHDWLHRACFRSEKLMRASLSSRLIAAFDKAQRLSVYFLYFVGTFCLSPAMFLCPAEITEIKEMLLPAKTNLSVYFLYFVGTFCLSPAMFYVPQNRWSSERRVMLAWTIPSRDIWRPKVKFLINECHFRDRNLTNLFKSFKKICLICVDLTDFSP